jgi:hypothetical protein
MEKNTVKIRLTENAPEQCEISVGNVAVVLKKGAEVEIAEDAAPRFLGTGLVEIVETVETIETKETVETLETEETETSEKAKTKTKK